MQKRWIIHVDLNNFFAAVECLHNPSIRKYPVAVCGETELRHGVVVAKNPLAKQRGVKTGHSVNEAKAICPELVTVPQNMDLYYQFSQWAREIYMEYADLVESYGLDEVWADISNITSNEHDARMIADEIREKIREQLGLTCSIGVSFNKTYSKLASDIYKIDATHVIPRENYKAMAWGLPVENLLGVGTRTAKIFHVMGMTTIGDIAKAPVDLFEDIFGKNGRTLHRYAHGDETSPVKHRDYIEPPKSVGNTETTYRDMVSIEDVRCVIHALSESVASRLREQHYKCRTIQLYIRENDLKSCQRQATLEKPTYIAGTIAEKAIDIFMKKYKFTKPLRSIGVKACNLVPEGIGIIQMDLFDDTKKEEKQEKLAKTMDKLRSMFGYDIVQRGIVLADRKLTYIPPNYNRSGYRVGSPFIEA